MIMFAGGTIHALRNNRCPMNRRINKKGQLLRSLWNLLYKSRVLTKCGKVLFFKYAGFTRPVFLYCSRRCGKDVAQKTERREESQRHLPFAKNVCRSVHAQSFPQHEQGLQQNVITIAFSALCKLAPLCSRIPGAGLWEKNTQIALSIVLSVLCTKSRYLAEGFTLAKRAVASTREPGNINCRLVKIREHICLSTLMPVVVSHGSKI